jgi:hypothetical protein
MTQIIDIILQAFYRNVCRRMLMFAVAIGLVALGAGYATDSPYPFLIGAVVIVLLYVQLRIFKQRLVSGNYPANPSERKRLDAFFARNGGKVVSGISLD